MEISKIILNDRGYYEFYPKPGKSELSTYYAETYFQTNQGVYEQEYSEEEKLFFNNRAAVKYTVINQFSQVYKDRTLLDLGCGEGWVMNYFLRKGWDVWGIDYSVEGIRKHNPEILSKFLQGDIYEIVDGMISEGKKFSIVTLLNVLEHVVNPDEVLQKVKQLLLPGGILIIDVPNDFSALQLKLKETGKIQQDFWVKYPDHLSYFSNESLIKICSDNGFKCVKMIADFPIDFYLANDTSNYIIEKGKGKAAHRARLLLENLFAEISIQKTIAYYEAMADLGIGRQLTGFFQKIN